MLLRSLAALSAAGLLTACDGMTSRLDGGGGGDGRDASTSGDGATASDGGTTSDGGNSSADAGSGGLDALPALDAAPAGSVAEYTRRSVAGYCWQIERCPFADDDLIGQHLLFTGNAAVSCQSWAERVLESSRLDRAIAAGRLRFDSAAAERCLAAIGTTCTNLDRTSSLIPACREALRGLVPAGGSCQQSVECAGGWCDYVQDSGCGVCRADVARGAQCNLDDECTEAGLTGGSPWCLMNRCVEVKSAVATGVGQPCGLTSVVMNQVTFTTCPPDLYCSTSARDEMGACLRPVAGGAACGDNDTPCEGLNVCERPAGGGDRTCRPITVRTRPGEACDERNFVVCNPLARLTCMGGICVSIGDATEGASCRTGDYSDLDCGAGLFCSRDTHRCTRLLADGELCGGSRDCRSRTCTSSRPGDPPRCGDPVCR